MSKKRILVKLRNATKELKGAIRKQYPFGFRGHTIKIEGAKPYHVLYVDTDEAAYLVRVGAGISIDSEAEGMYGLDGYDEYNFVEA